MASTRTQALALFLVVAMGAAENAPVTFRVDMSSSEASSSGVYVSVFWPPPGNKLTDLDGDGVYEVTASLTVGTTYEYKFRNGKYNNWDGPGWEDGLCVYWP